MELMSSTKKVTKRVGKFVPLLRIYVTIDRGCY